MRRLLGLLAVIPLLSIPAQTTVRYRVEATNKTVIDMSAIAAALGGGADLPPSQEQMNTTVALISVTTRDTIGGKVVHIVVDSITSNLASSLSRMGEMPPEFAAMMGSAKGGTFDLAILNGKLRTPVMKPEISLELTQLTQMIPVLFPTIKPNARAGDRWVDTLAADSAVSYMGVKATPKNRSITTWTMAGADSASATTTTTTSMAVEPTEGGVATVGSSAAGTIGVRFDSARVVTAGSAVSTATGSMSMGELGSMTTKSTLTVQVKRLP